MKIIEFGVGTEN